MRPQIVLLTHLRFFLAVLVAEKSKKDMTPFLTCLKINFVIIKIL